MPGVKKLFCEGEKNVYFVIILMEVQLPHCVNRFLFAQEIRNVLLPCTSLQCCHRPRMKTTYVNFRTKLTSCVSFYSFENLVPCTDFFFENSIIYRRTNYILAPIVSSCRMKSFKVLNETTGFLGFEGSCPIYI